MKDALQFVSILGTKTEILEKGPSIQLVLKDQL